MGCSFVCKKWPVQLFHHAFGECLNALTRQTGASEKITGWDREWSAEKHPSVPQRRVYAPPLACLSLRSNSRHSSIPPKNNNCLRPCTQQSLSIWHKKCRIHAPAHTQHFSFLRFQKLFGIYFGRYSEDISGDFGSSFKEHSKLSDEKDETKGRK